MRLHSNRRFALVACLLFATVGRAAEPTPVAIFDGQSLAGWEGNTAVWRVERGSITGEIPDKQSLDRNEFLFFNDEAGDLELTLEYRISGKPAANSGIQFRSRKLTDGGAAGYQADLDDGATWLGRIDDEHGRELLVERGARVSIAPDGHRWADAFAKPDDFRELGKPNEWNRYRIRATGPHVEVWINDRLCSVLDDHDAKAAEYAGRIALQLHSGPGPAKIEFRAIRLTRLGQTDLPTRDAVPADAKNRQTQSAALWHLRANPAKPSAVAGEEAQRVVADMKLTDGFQAELIAAEPDVHQPIAFAIDERGRLWVVEAFSYPNKQPEGQGKDRIRILADGDGDGSFETKTTFVEGLNLVSGIELGFGGVWIGAAPQLLFIPDRDRDDRPDGPPQVLLDGFGFQDTHETLNSFTWGPDGWLYGNQGVFNTSRIGKPGASDAERLEMRAGIWRYHPTRHAFEVFAHGGSNQWGLDFNRVGHLFTTHCRSYWGGGGTTYAIRNGHFWNQANSDYPAYVSNAAPPGIAHLRNYLPASARYDSGEGGAGKPGTDLVYGGHSHVGTMIYLGDNWPEIYRDHLFTHNLHGHQINHQHNVRQGSAYETFHAGYDLLHAPDPAYVPVDLQYGPDGAVYVIDWVDRQHCHNPRAENWDRTNGRVYRIAWSKTFRPVSVDLRAKSDRELVELQAHRNQWYARTARRLLQERAAAGQVDESIVRDLQARLESPNADAVLASLWSLHAIDRLEREQLDEALESGNDVVREWAVRLATQRADKPQLTAERLARLAQHDPSPMVRLAIASALPVLSNADRWRLGAALAAHGEDASDRFLPRMIWFGLAPTVPEDVARAVALARSTALPHLSDWIYWHVARSAEGREAVGQVIAETNDDREAVRLARLLHFSLQYDATLDRPASWTKVLDRIAATQDAGALALCEELSAVFGDENVREQMRARLSDSASPISDRRRALAVLRRVGDRQAATVYLRLLDDRALRADVIPLLARSADPEISHRLMKTFGTFADAEKSLALGVLTSRPEFALPLLTAVAGGSFDKKHLSALQIRQMHELGHEDVSRLLEKVWGQVGGSSADAKAAIAKLRNTYTTAPLWAYDAGRGAEVFKKNCAACHPLDGASIPLGPSLAGSWRNGLEYFLENILDPNAVVGQNYQATIVVTDDGLTLTGLVDSESDQALVLRTAERTITIPKSTIEDRRVSNQSIMPTGLLNELSEIETIELLKFLTSKR